MFVNSHNPVCGRDAFVSSFFCDIVFTTIWRHSVTSWVARIAVIAQLPTRFLSRLIFIPSILCEYLSRVCSYLFFAKYSSSCGFVFEVVCTAQGKVEMCWIVMFYYRLFYMTLCNVLSLKYQCLTQHFGLSGNISTLLRGSPGDITALGRFKHSTQHLLGFPQ